MNIFFMFYLMKVVLFYLKKGSFIINIVLIIVYKGNKMLIDYLVIKGVIVMFIRLFFQLFVQQGIWVNVVVSGFIWILFILVSFVVKDVEVFGLDVLMECLGQLVEVVLSYLYFVSDDFIYVIGQMIYVNGGIIVNG